MNHFFPASLFFSYENAIFKNRNGKSSVDLRLLNAVNRTVAAMEIRSWKRAQLNQYLVDNGFRIKTAVDEEKAEEVEKKEDL